MVIQLAESMLPKNSILWFRKISDMKVKTHSILALVNAHADVDRSLRERSEVEAEWQIQDNSGENVQPSLQDRTARYKKGPGNREPSKKVSWGVLFDSEYIWAPDVGPILIVCPNMTTNCASALTGSRSSALSNCCILKFVNQLSTCSPLRIFHGY